MRVLASWGMYLALFLLAHMFGFGLLGSTLPTAQAQARIADNVWPALAPLLKKTPR